ncbi:P-loop containing nucleoside triphosphate hydrolase protein [Cantharellus anzutake]|uniref:P-loop containing nucleoside triphosphate hydrolase protein n=1 Tax=Cantharellus anzutake TaxID=1750568 RepID=UPI0019064BE5|nr:P-loop containing nucleoside triphosphate hydrolase protein [Cantharellus anzutake]KAF8321890.1 P-loop containing nucleoside triphosphate hydrolase protein [Cantharellus anzutake]
MPAVSTLAIIPALYNLGYAADPLSFDAEDELTRLPFVDEGFINGLGLSRGLFPRLPDGTLDITTRPSWWLALRWSRDDEEKVCRVFNECTHLRNASSGGRGGHKALVETGKHIKRSNAFKLISSWTIAFWAAARLNEKVEISLKDSGHHPFTMMDLNNTTQFPAVPSVPTEKIAVECFGQGFLTQCSSDGKRFYPAAAEPAILALVQLTFHRIRAFCNRGLRSAEGDVLKMEELFKLVDPNSPESKPQDFTISNLNRAWSAIIKVTGLPMLAMEDAEREKLKTRVSELEEEMKETFVRLHLVDKDAAGLCRKGTANVKGLTKEFLQTVRSLSSDPQVENFKLLLNEWFEQSREVGEVPSFSEAVGNAQEGVDAVDQLFGGGKDVGTSSYAQLTEHQVKAELDMLNPWPYFNERYDPRGLLTPASGPEWREAENAPLAFHQHQLDGVLAMHHMLFCKETERVREKQGILVADGMGLGKTAQIIAFIVHLEMQRQRLANGQRPAAGTLFETLPHPASAGHKWPSVQQPQSKAALSEGPVMIVASNTLIGSWKFACEQFLKGDAYDIFPYVSNMANSSTLLESYRSSYQPESRRIILASTSALRKQHKELMGHRPSKQWESPSIIARRRGKTDDTIFSVVPSLLVIDEIQTYRTNPSYMFFFRDLAQFTIGLTGTPLITDPKDIINIGWAIGTPPLQDPELYKVFQEDHRMARNAMKAARNGTKGKANVRTWGALIRQGRASSAASFEPFAKARDKFNSVLETLRNAFSGHILRRTPSSLGRDGNPLVNLPPVTFYPVWVTLEPDHLDRLTADIDDAILKAVEVDRFGHFHLRARKGSDHPDAIEASTQAPVFDDAAQYHANGGAKWKTMLHIIAHGLASDTAPPITLDTHGHLVPTLDTTLAQWKADPDCPRKRRIAVYMDFTQNVPSFASAIRHVLGFEPFTLTGNTDHARRREMVSQWQCDENRRVLIFTSVAAMGINLSAADTLIIANVQWSAQDRHQIYTRVHRQPQRKEVRVYDILTEKTADILLIHAGDVKARQLESFLGSETGVAYQGLIQGITPLNEKEQAADPAAETKESNTQTRRKRSTPLDDDDEEISSRAIKIAKTVSAGEKSRGRFGGWGESSGIGSGKRAKGKGKNRETYCRDTTAEEGDYRDGGSPENASKDGPSGSLTRSERLKKIRPPMETTATMRINAIHLPVPAPSTVPNTSSSRRKSHMPSVAPSTGASGHMPRAARSSGPSRQKYHMQTAATNSGTSGRQPYMPSVAPS